MKPSSNYKMSKALKTSLASFRFKDAHDRGQWKRAMIDAELSAAIKPKAERGRKGAEEN